MSVARKMVSGVDSVVCQGWPPWYIRPSSIPSLAVPVLALSGLCCRRLRHEQTIASPHKSPLPPAIASKT